MLSTKRSSEELQTELFDLCGFDRFDMIGAVLENREALVRSLKQNKVEMRAELSRVAASLAAEKAGEAKPNFGCQVGGGSVVSGGHSLPGHCAVRGGEGLAQAGQEGGEED